MIDGGPSLPLAIRVYATCVSELYHLTEAAPAASNPTEHRTGYMWQFRFRRVSFCGAPSPTMEILRLIPPLPFSTLYRCMVYNNHDPSTLFALLLQPSARKKNHTQDDALQPPRACWIFERSPRRYSNMNSNSRREAASTAAPSRVEWFWGATGFNHS